MSLRGNLNSVDLANIFQMLSINQKEGTLNIFDGESKKSIYFSQDGVSMLSRGKVKKDTLGRILLRYDKLNEDELDRALQMQRQTGKLLGVILEDSGLVPREVIEDALRIQIEEEIYNLFIWKDASFEFIEGIPPREFEEIDGAITRLTFNVNSLIMEAARRIDEWEHIQRHVVSMGEVYRYSGKNMELTDDVFREPYCEKVLAAIDGRVNVEEIIDRSYVNRFEVCKIIALLLEQQAIEAVTVADLEEIAEDSIERGQVEDGIKFLGRIIELRGETPETHQKLGKAFERIHEIAKAAHHYRVFAEHRLTSGGVDDAFAVYRRICELVPTDLQAGDRLIEIFTSHPDRLGGESAAEVIEKGKTLATIYLELKKNTRAIQSLHRVIALAPEDFSLRNLLINIYLANGMSSEAIGEYESMAEWYYRKKDWDKVILIHRKILVIDRSRDDVNHRLQQLIARKERRKKGRKRILLLAVTVIGLAGLGVAYYQYDAKARSDIAVAEARAAEQVAKIAQKTKRVTSELERIRKEISRGDVDAEGLRATLSEAESLNQRFQGEIRNSMRELQRLADEYKFSTVRTTAVQRQDELKLLLVNFEQLLKDARNQIQTKAVELVTEAEGLLEKGEVTKALECYEKARSLPIDDRVLADKKVDKNIANLRAELAKLRTGLAEQEAAIGAGDFVRARVIGVELLESFFFWRELRDQVRIAVRVESWPEGGRVLLNDQDAGVRTPGWILYSPTRGAEVSVALDGYRDAVESIPPVDLENHIAALACVRELQEIKKSLRKKVLWAPRLEGNIDAPLAVEGSSVMVLTRRSQVFRLGPKAQSLEQVYQAKDISGFGAGAVATRTDLYLCPIEGPVERISLATGKPVWSQQVSGTVYAPLVLAGDILLVGDRKGYLSALAAEDGRRIWIRHFSGEIRSRPVVSRGMVFLTTMGGMLHVLDLENGGTDVIPPFVPGGGTEQPLYCSPLVREDRIYVGGANRTLYAYDIGTFQLAWSHAVDEEISCAPVFVAGAVIVAGVDGTLYAIRDGRLLDTLEIGGGVRCSPTIRDRSLYVCSDAARVVGAEFDGKDFAVRWRYDLEGEKGEPLRVSVSAVAVDGRVVVAAESGELFVLDE